jgi:nucleoside-diphosphate-sugar epimerase
MASTGRVLITGIAGTIGRVLINFLREHWELCGIDLVPVNNVPILVADITDKEALVPAFQDVYAVIHLAARSGARWDEVLHSNIIGASSVFEAAKRTGVQKIIFASSNHVTGLYENDEPYKSIIEGRYENLKSDLIPRITHQMPTRPDSYYGFSKAFGEALGRYYSESFGIEVFCLRIGSANQENCPMKPRHFATMISHRDLAGLVDTCLLVENVSFDIFYGVSANTWRFWDIDHPRDVLGWIPQDNAEVFRDAAPTQDMGKS